MELVGNNGWVAITHGVKLIVVVGKAPFPQLAKHFVNTVGKVDAFVASHEAPFIAKLYRPASHELAKNANAPGSISLWYPVA